MHETLGTIDLPHGERIQIAVVTAPDHELRHGIADLLAHKGGDWDYHIDAALAGRTDRLETRFYLCTLEDRPIANAMIVERHGIGILGHVFTRPEHRRKGICRELLSRLMDDFRSRNGSALLLGTGFESVAYRIYESFGFRSLRGGFMEWTANGALANDEAWFAPGSARTSPAAWEHWPLTAFVASRPEATGLRSVAWGIADIANLEWPYLHFMRLVDRGEAHGAVAQTETGAVVACATCHPLRIGEASNPWPGVCLVDAFAHPLHLYKLGEVLAALRLGPGKAIAFVQADDQIRTAALSQVGFALEGTLGGMLQGLPIPADVAVYGRTTETVL